ncbi:MAG: IS3 family transposase, partial [Nitrosomonas sp.]|nr:IS3 family transposase [Nitrosomonas sp.]
WDTPMESFWGTLKSELVHHQKFKTRKQAKEEITKYIEIFYNRQRKQERLDYLSPVEFKQRYYANLFAS